jgi:hypothetical protein
MSHYTLVNVIGYQHYFLLALAPHGNQREHRKLWPMAKGNDLGENPLVPSTQSLGFSV